MSDILWLVLFAALFITIPYTYYKKGIKTSIAVAYAFAVIIFARLFYEEQGIKASLISLVFSAQLFTFGVNGRELFEVISHVSDAVSPSFIACVWLCYIVCPILTVSVVLVYIKRGLDRTAIKTRFFKDVYIFTERNENTLLLAQDICSDKKRVVVFANTDSFDVGLRLLCVPYTASDVCNMLNKTNKVHICFNDTDTGVLLDNLTTLLEKEKLTKENDIYVFSDNAIAHEVIDGIKKKHRDKTIKVISTNAILMREILWDYPLYSNMHQKDEINVTVMGVGDFGGYFAMNTLWCATLPDCPLRLNLVDMDTKDNILRRVSDNINDGDFDIRVFNENINTNTFFDKIASNRIYNSDYILVAMGNDDLNISVSRKLRLFFARCKRHPFIITVIKNQSKFDVISEALKTDDIAIVGGKENIHSYKSIFEDRFFQRAFKVYQIVENHYNNYPGENDFYKQNQIDIFSSYANAIHSKYKVFSIMNEADLSIEKAKCILNTNCEIFDKTVRSEHDRWVAFEMLKGYVGVPDGDIDAFLAMNHENGGKLHKNTALKMHACITEFDNLDVIDKKICDICNKDPNLKEIDVLITKNTFSIYSGE